MKTTATNLPERDRRKFPRFYVGSHLKLAIEDESLKESIGLGEPGDISLGGLRVFNLPACLNVTVGDQLGLLLMDEEEALTLRGEVVHHGTEDSIGIEFRDMSPSENRAMRGIIKRLH
jgi:PilZ domain